jgi:alkylation response protein AidB-like acyl-CoA dehydrogenase
MQSASTEPLTLDYPLLNALEVYLQKSVAPRAASLDADPEALQQAFRELGEQGWLGLLVPPAWQGTGLNELTFRVSQELFARYSGALAFLQTQHQSAAGKIAQSPNAELKQSYLPAMVIGEKRVGLGFSQLRRPEPLVKAIPVASGYLISGEVPWITGFGCFEEFIIGAVLPDGQALFGLAPFKEIQSNGSIRLSQPLQLAAMASTNTVTASLTDWFLPNEQLLDVKPAGWIHQSDRRNVLHHGFFALGCAQAGLDIMATARQAELGAATRQSLEQELSFCRRAIYQAQATGNTGIEQLHLRAEAIELATRCTHAAVVLSGGAANYANHPAQRVYREALAFTIFGQTEAVKQATLKQLIH